MRAALTLFFLSVLPADAGAFAPASLEGPAQVLDGDTLDISGQRVRLYGIDAPESAQTCTRDGQDYPCGKEATAYLQGLIGQQSVSCTPWDQDRYGRTVAVCTTPDGTDLNEAMVRAGQALAYRRYSSAYVFDEAQAKADGLGLWGSSFTPPWQWRQTEARNQHHKGSLK